MSDHYSQCALGPVAVTVFLLASTASADVIPPSPRQPLRCPPGHHQTADHGGHYCRPPAPKKCPADHIPRVVGRSAYCEPPPKEPCPAGSDWTSMSAGDTFCQAESSCGSSSCGTDATCVPTSFCLAWTCFRCSMTRIVGACKTDADCPRETSLGEQTRCVREYRCDPKKKRLPAGYTGRASRPMSEAKLRPVPRSEPASCAYKECSPGFECLPVSLCVDRGDPSRSPRAQPSRVLGSCSGGAVCPERSVCSRQFRCLEPRETKPRSGETKRPGAPN